MKTISVVAAKQGHAALSEYDSKRMLAEYGIPVTREIQVASAEDLEKAAAAIGYPLVLKGCAPGILHKTEQRLVEIDIRDVNAARSAFESITARMAHGAGSVLVQEMITGERELTAGMVLDPQFGPCVMFGLGGLFAEIFHDVSFRVAPLEKGDALDMMREIHSRQLLGPFRQLPAADKDMLADILISLGRIGLENNAVQAVDINPVILSSAGKPIAADALVILAS